MKIDLTVTISVILGISAIISPIIVSIINNHYQLKLKKYENYDLAKIKALETFSQNAGTHISVRNGYTDKDFINSLYGLLPYFDINKSDLDILVDGSMNKNVLIDETNKLIHKLSRQIRPNK